MSNRVDEALMVALQRKTGLSRRRLQEVITARADSDAWSRRVAALAVARDNGVSLTRFASPEDRADLRHVGSVGGSPTRPASAQQPAQGLSRRARRTSTKRPTRSHDNSVFVVHGRNEALRADLFALLRTMGLNPIEWNKALTLTKKGSPYVGEVLDAAFERAAAVVVLLTPDDLAQLKPEFQRKGDPTWEKRLTGQARPNVLFEAGMAFGRHPRSTVLVQVGKLREFSDVGGRHVVRLSDSVASRQQLAAKLQAAGCRVDLTGTDWTSTGHFRA